MVLGNEARGHELAGRHGLHLWPVVGHGQQHRGLVVLIGEHVEPCGEAGLDGVPQPFCVEGLDERDLALGGGLPGATPRWRAICG